MKLNVTKILSTIDVSKLQLNNKDDFMIGFAHIKVFINNYYDCLFVIDIELALAVNRNSKVPQSMMKGQVSLKDYVDGEIVHKPLGVVFLGKNKNRKMTKFLFQVYDVDRYTNSQYTSLLVHLGNYKKNTIEDKAKI